MITSTKKISVSAPLLGRAASSDSNFMATEPYESETIPYAIRCGLSKDGIEIVDGVIKALKGKHSRWSREYGISPVNIWANIFTLRLNHRLLNFDSSFGATSTVAAIVGNDWTWTNQSSFRNTKNRRSFLGGSIYTQGLVCNQTKAINFGSPGYTDCLAGLPPSRRRLSYGRICAVFWNGSGHDYQSPNYTIQTQASATAYPLDVNSNGPFSYTAAVSFLNSVGHPFLDGHQKPSFSHPYTNYTIIRTVECSEELYATECSDYLPFGRCRIDKFIPAEDVAKVCNILKMSYISAQMAYAKRFLLKVKSSKKLSHQKYSLLEEFFWAGVEEGWISKIMSAAMPIFSDSSIDSMNIFGSESYGSLPNGTVTSKGWKSASTGRGIHHGIYSVSSGMSRQDNHLACFFSGYSSWNGSFDNIMISSVASLTSATYSNSGFALGFHSSKGYYVAGYDDGYGRIYVLNWASTPKNGFLLGNSSGNFNQFWFNGGLVSTLGVTTYLGQGDELPIVFGVQSQVDCAYFSLGQGFSDIEASQYSERVKNLMAILTEVKLDS